MQPGELEKIKQLIKTSTILTDVERTEWLELLPVMNQKQLDELKAILVPGMDQQSSSPVKPPLAHIANLPTGLDMRLTSPPPALTDKQQFPGQLSKVVQEKELPAPHSTIPGPISYPKSPNPPSATLNAVPKPPTTFNNASSPVSAGAGKIASLADVSQLTLQSFRTLGPASLLNALRGLMKNSDYFEVMFTLEKSPLFKSYVSGGKQALHNEGFQNQTSSTTTINKQEFETITDVLRQLQSSP